MVELENCSWCYIYITTVRLFGTCDCSDSYFWPLVPFNGPRKGHLSLSLVLASHPRPRDSDPIPAYAHTHTQTPIPILHRYTITPHHTPLPIAPEVLQGRDLALRLCPVFRSATLLRHDQRNRGNRTAKRKIELLLTIETLGASKSTIQCAMKRRNFSRQYFILATWLSSNQFNCIIEFTKVEWKSTSKT